MKVHFRTTGLSKYEFGSQFITVGFIKFSEHAATILGIRNFAKHRSIIRGCIF